MTTTVTWIWNSMCCYHGNVLCSMATKDFWCTCSHTVCARSCPTAADSLRLNQQEWFLLFKFPPLLLSKVTVQRPLTEMSEHRGRKGMCPSVEPYFPALDSAAEVRFAPVCPAALIMLDLGSEEFTLRLSEYLQIRRSAVNSAFFSPRHDLNLSARRGQRVTCHVCTTVTCRCSGLHICFPHREDRIMQPM